MKGRIPGRVITLLGIALLASSFFVQDEPPNLFLPIMLIVIGRSISRKASREQARAESTGSRPEGSVTVETLQEEFGSMSTEPPPQRQAEPTRQHEIMKTLEDRLREALMVPPVTAPPAPQPRPRVIRSESPPEAVEAPVIEVPRPVAPPAKTAPRVETLSGGTPRRVDTTPLSPAAGGLSSIRPSYPRISSLTRRTARTPTVPQAPAQGDTKTSAEMVAEAKKRLEELRSQSSPAADRRA